MKEKIYDARTGMEYVLVGDYYLPALKLPRTRPIGRWGMLHKAYLKLRKPAYYQSFTFAESHRFPLCVHRLYFTITIQAHQHLKRGIHHGKGKTLCDLNPLRFKVLAAAEQFTGAARIVFHHSRFLAYIRCTD